LIKLFVLLIKRLYKLYYRLIDCTVTHLINNLTAIDRAITRVRFNRSKSFNESNVIIKNIGKVKVIVNFFAKNILNKK